MIYFLAGVFFFLLQSFLILTTNLNIFPEIFFFSWLIHKGLIPYRDFFDHHGFLLNYILAPFSGSVSSFENLKIIYFIFQTGNLLLVLIVLGKTTNKIGFLYGGFIFVLLNFIISENNFWFEIGITPLLLLVYLLLIQKKSGKLSVFTGFIIAIASFIKPSALVILIPTVIYSRNAISAVTVFICWSIVLIYFYVHNILGYFINSVIRFNYFLSGNYREYQITYPKLVYAIGFLILISFFAARKQKNVRFFVLSSLFLPFCLIFLTTGFNSAHFLPFVTFFVLLISQVSNFRPFMGKNICMVAVFIFMLIVAQKSYYQYQYTYKQRIPWQADKNTQSLIAALKSTGLDNERIYVLNNHVEIYEYLNQLPPTYYPVIFPLIDKYDTNLENRIINDIRNQEIELIVFPKSQIEEYSHYLSLKKFISQYYSIFSDTPSYTIFKRI